ncbi:permease-related [Anaeramoeba ignava]|uniref:Permease-related n=1 Tax=Anaeramoeba ignava TaxID=1746090 RepID=A0A9Q0LFZ9_ANAIG|nr:permease-related [Anaeramoeba ignava]
MNKNFSFYKKIQIISAILISLFCGSPNAFNHLNSKIKDDQNYSENFMSQLASYGMVGLYFTIPAGILYDRIGPRFTSILGSILASGGYLLMSFIPGKFSMSFFFVIVGFGLGFSFIVSLGTAVKASSEKFRGFSVACVGSAMSLSMGLVVLIFQCVECFLMDFIVLMLYQYLLFLLLTF